MSRQHPDNDNSEIHSEASIIMRKRLTLQTRSESEFDAEKDHHDWYWRYGWPSLPIPPIRTIRRGAYPMVPDFLEVLLPKINQILELHELPPSHVYLAFRCPRQISEEAGRQKAYLTLVCLVSVIDTPRSPSLQTPFLNPQKNSKNLRPQPSWPLNS